MTLLDPKERSARGAAIAEAVTGRPAAAPTTPVEESWRDFIFAEIWSRPGLDRRSRTLITLASATLFGEGERIDDFVHGALAGGELSLTELREAALHLSVYGGWSRGGALDRAITRVADEMGLAAPELAPIRAAPWDPETRIEEGVRNFEAVMTFSGGKPFTPFTEAISNFVFGEMWRRDGLDERSRRWLTLVGVCASGAEVPIMSHVHAAIGSGNCTPEEMMEFVLQYGVFAGWPRASAIQAAALAMAKKVQAGLPWNG